jgi:prophage tail gpP-like protein
VADRLRLTNTKTGDTLEQWESAEWSSDYLTPCDTFRFEAGSDDAPIVVAKRFPVDAPVRVSLVLEAGGVMDLLDGYVDSTDVEVARAGGGGRRCVIEGRDFLSDVVDSNVDPRLKLPLNPTLEQLIDAVLKGEPFNLDYETADLDVRADLALNPLMKKPKARAPTRPSRKSKKTKAKDAYQPRDGESAYAYLARMCSLFGYNLSATYYENRRHVILGGPNYEKEPYYTLRLLDGALGQENNVLYASTRLDMTNIPREVIVKGGAFAKGEATKNLSVLTSSLTRRPRQVYVSDQRAKDKDTSERVARATLGRLQRTFATYRVKVQGFTDRETGKVYLVNNIATVDDDMTGLHGPMWIESVTMRESRRAGRTTDLKLIPKKTYVLDWLPDETVGSTISDGVPVIEQLDGRDVDRSHFLHRDARFYDGQKNGTR